MTEIAGGRWDNLLARLFPIKGRPISPGMSPELMPVVIVQPEQPEMALLRSERLYSASVVQGGVAGQTCKGLIRNPANSGGLVILEAVWLFNIAGAIDCQIRTQPLPSPPVDLATVFTGSTRDTRIARGVATSAVPGFAIVSNETSVAAPVGAIHFHVNLPAVTPIPVTMPFVLGPNTALEVNGVQANQGFGFAFFWRERAAEPSEL